MLIPIIRNVVCGDVEPFIEEDFIEITKAERKIVRLAKKPVLVEVVGKSMQPKFFNGNVLLFDMEYTPLLNNSIVAVSHNSKILVKVINLATPNSLILFSYNLDFMPIVVNDFDNTIIFAKFVSFLRNKE